MPVDPEEPDREPAVPVPDEPLVLGVVLVTVSVTVAGLVAVVAGVVALELAPFVVEPVGGR